MAVLRRNPVVFHVLVRQLALIGIVGDGGRAARPHRQPVAGAQVGLVGAAQQELVIGHENQLARVALGGRRVARPKINRAFPLPMARIS